MRLQTSPSITLVTLMITLAFACGGGNGGAHDPDAGAHDPDGSGDGGNATLDAGPAPDAFVGTGVVHTIGSGSGPLIHPEVPGLECGDTIRITAGIYEGITLRGLSGCPGNPIIIENGDGVVEMQTWGLELKAMHHVIVRTHGEVPYGFLITAPFRAGVSISESASDIDVSGTHSKDGGYGIVVKTDPACDVLAHVDPMRIENIRIHDNLIENSFYEAGDVNLNCDGQAHVVRAERLAQVLVYRNTLRNTGNDAIKLRLCHDGCDIIDNHIDGYGVLRDSDGGWCFGITVGSETWGKILGNVVQYGYCSAIDVRTNETEHVYEISGNTTRFAGTLPGGAVGASWAGGILFNIMVAGQKFYIHDNASSDHLGADLEFTNYGFVDYEGSQCRNGATIKITNGMTPVPVCE